MNYFIVLIIKNYINNNIENYNIVDNKFVGTMDVCFHGQELLSLFQ